MAELVDGVTKLTNIEVDSMDEKQALTLRKMFLAMSKDIRVIIVKLADRLHNMRTLAALREDRRLFKARETMDVYAPLADRLGMSSIKWELEDLSFFYLEPDAYQRIARMVAESREVRERYLAETIKTLTDELNRIGLEDFQINRPLQALLVHLPKDEAQGQGVLRDLRPGGAARNYPFGARLLLHARCGAYAVAPHAWSL